MKKVTLKVVTPAKKELAVSMTDVDLPRPMYILALGGSVTWGVKLENSRDSYPWLIGSTNVKIDNVDNLAMPEMGAYYSAICLESIIPDSAVKNYDVILLDFVSSNNEGFPWLLQRLRERYPEAILIYVHIWPLKELVQTTTDGLQPDILGLDPELDWRWIRDKPNKDQDIHQFHPQMKGGTRAAMNQVGGIFFSLEFPRDPKQAMAWFSNDWQHLSAEGHKMVAIGVLNLLSSMEEDVFKPKRLGSFGMGDQCYTWFTSTSRHIKENPHLNGFLIDKSPKGLDLSSQNSFDDTWLLEMDPGEKGTIEFENKFSTSVPIVLAYMSNREAAPLYLSVEVSINGEFTVKINPNHFYNPKHFPEVKYTFIGLATSGKNVVNFKAVDRQRKIDLPFRVVGLFLNSDYTYHSKVISTIKDYVDPSDKLSGRHIVFCFFQPDPRLSPFKVDYDIVNAAVSAAAERVPPEWKIHVITSGDVAIQSLSSHANVNVVDYRDAPFSHILQRFKREYIPQSANDQEYEKFCTFRWIIIFEYFFYLKFRGISVKNIVSVDTDVFLLENPLLIDETINWNDIESYRIIDGAAVIWSLQGLHSFVNFLIESYSSKEKAVGLVSQWGSLTDCVPANSLLIPCFLKGTAERLVMWHMNDMYWYIHWVAENPELRIRKPPAMKITHSYACEVVRKMEAGEKYRFIRDGSEIKLTMTRTEITRVCMVHFNGVLSKALAVPFNSFLKGSRSECLLSL